MFRKNNHPGFTLIELLVVIAIVGLLATISIVSLGSMRAKARDAKRVADMRQLRTALEMYYLERGDYPSQQITLSEESSSYNAPFCLQASTVGFAYKPCNTASGTIFMAAVPMPPSPADGSCKAMNDYGFDDGISKNYYYYIKGTNTYTIQFCLGSSVGGLAAGFHTSTPSGIQ